MIPRTPPGQTRSRRRYSSRKSHPPSHDGDHEMAPDGAAEDAQPINGRPIDHQTVRKLVENEERLTGEQAIIAVRDLEMPARQIAPLSPFGRECLRKRSKMANPPTSKCKPGKQPEMLGEDDFASELVKLIDGGAAITPQVAMRWAKQCNNLLAVEQYRTTIGSRNQSISDYSCIPGFRQEDYTSGWWSRFAKRHFDLLESVNRKPISAKRFDALTNEVCVSTVTELDRIVKEFDIPPSRCWNFDETGVDRKDEASVRSKVLSRPNSKMQTADTKTSLTKHITLFGCINAAGGAMDPWICFPGKRYTTNLVAAQTHWIRNHKMHLHLHGSAKGWNDGTAFWKWFKLTFVPESRKGCSEDDYVLLIVDGVGLHYHQESSTMPLKTTCTSTSCHLTQHQGSSPLIVMKVRLHHSSHLCEQPLEKAISPV
jgi:DDE superfamily endonuclease